MISRKPGALWTELGGQIVILSIEHSRCYEMNALGVYLWKLLETPRELSELVGQVVARYRVEPAQGSEDVLKFLQQLAAVDMIVGELPTA